ncbi:hypothetical protein EON63_12870 [archaeon]|nr:MAG: hypothetical protein EON63_12870 [archaeon]
MGHDHVAHGPVKTRLASVLRRQQRADQVGAFGVYVYVLQCLCACVGRMIMYEFLFGCMCM